jgi:hypothetical protein
MKKIKSTKTILEKKNKKNHKKNYVGKYCSNPQCFKEKNYKAKFSTSSILKNKSIKIILKKKRKKEKKKKTILEKKMKNNGKKNMWGKLKLNSQPV